MKNIQTLIIFLFSIGVSAQNITEINSDLKISDSLTYSAEVRIYQGGGTTNYSSLFRMFKDKSKKWTAEFYEHYATVDGQTELRTKKKTLKSKNDMEFIYLNLIRSNILYLPNQNDINWKLKKRGNVQKITRKRKGKEIVEYDILDGVVSILDGVSYKIEIRELSNENKFEFYNPESYLVHYPEIDELIYMCEILNTIRTEFKIWKK